MALIRCPHCLKPISVQLHRRSEKQTERLQRTDLNTPVEKLNLSIRTTTMLQSEGIRHIGQLTEVKDYELLRCPNFGRKSLEELKNALAEYGIRIGENA